MSFKDKIFKNQSPWGSSPGGGAGGENGSGTRREPPNLDDLIKNFQKTINKFYPTNREERAKRAETYEDIIEAAMGLSGEAGEVLEIIKKRVYYGKPYSLNLADELGDTLHYLARMCELNGLTLEQVAERNLQKLNKRYSNAVYTDEQAIAQGEKNATLD